MSESVKHASARKAGEIAPAERQPSLAPRYGESSKQAARDERLREPDTRTGLECEKISKPENRVS